MTEAVGHSAKIRKTLFACLGLVAGMTGLAFASAPLYSIFCQLTGFGGTTRVATTAPTESIIDRTIAIRFDTNVSTGLPWTFEAEIPALTLKVGQTATVFYKITNHGAYETVGVAAFNVQPDLSGGYFNKLECFCFTDMRLKPGETVEVPVVFFVDPSVVNERDLNNLDMITLSYTFFESKNASQPVAALTDPEKPQL